MWIYEIIIRYYFNSCIGYVKISLGYDFIGIMYKSFVFEKYDDVYMYLNFREVFFRFWIFKINFFLNDKGNWKIF